MIKRGYADCSEGQIHYREAGPRDAPVIAFFHQTASSGAMFEQVMSKLAGEYRCLAFDSPGFGQSYQPDAIPTIGYLSDRLVEALDSLGVERFHACGHHTGGCVAVEMPVRYPGRVASLTIIAPVLVNDAEKAEYKKVFVRPFTVESSGEFLKTAWDYLRMIGAGSDALLHTRELVDHLIAHRTMPMAFSAVWEQDVDHFYRAVDVPMLIMCSRDDVLWPLFERAKSVRPDARAVEVGGGDYQPDRDPEGVAKALGDFLKTGL